MNIIQDIMALSDGLSNEQRDKEIREMLSKELKYISDYLADRNISFMIMLRTIDPKTQSEITAGNFVGYGKEDTHRLSFITEKMVELIRGYEGVVEFMSRDEIDEL